MQCKDIPDEPVLRFLAALNGVWAFWWSTPTRPGVDSVMPAGTPPKLVLAKMRQLIRRGLVDGCPCGCRGDFVLTEKGGEWLGVRDAPMRALYQSYLRDDPIPAHRIVRRV